MPEWAFMILVPASAGIASFVGTVIAVRVDIAWIKDTLTRHEDEFRRLHSRISDR